MRLSFMYLAMIAVLLGMSGAASADTLLQYSSGKAGGSAKSVKMYVRPGVIRISNAGDRYMLYKNDQNTLYIVQPSKKIYTAVDSASIKVLAQRMAKVRQRYREEIKKLPQDKRQQVEKQLGPLMQKNDQPVVFTRTGGTESVSGYHCAKGVAKRGGVVLQKLCVASSTALGMTGREYGTVQQMYQLMAKLEQATGFVQGAPDIASLNGIPISLTQVNTSTTQTLENVDHRRYPDSLYELPKNFSRQDVTGK